MTENSTRKKYLDIHFQIIPYQTQSGLELNLILVN